MYGMNQNFNPADPSSLVPLQILPHVHLVSSYRFPTTPALQPAHALEYLTKGPTIVKDTQPVAWTYFPAPPADGTLLLTWQPPRMGTNFASDGLIWADAEIAYDMQVRGYNLQVLIHKSGYFANEPFTSHARYRYRLTQGPGHFDSQLWMVHYTAADPANRIPSSQIPVPREIAGQLQTRAQLEAAGTLIRKEFMLADRPKWPKVEFTRAAGQQPPYYNPMQQGRAYNQPPPNKRARPSMAQRPPVPSGVAADHSLEEEENSTQDAFDFITPREISQSRYKQHHEWMEEIFSSPYAVGAILPIDLGLGLMGQLAPLTDGILDAPAGEHPSRDRQDPKSRYDVKTYSKLTPDQLKDFEARVAEYGTKAEAELEKMKATHAKKLADLKRSRTYIKAERRLRDIPRAEAARSADTSAEEEGADLLEGIVKGLETNLGVVFDTKKNVICVDEGGFIEEQQPPPPKPQSVTNNGTTQSIPDNGSSGVMDSMDADNSAASLLDQYGSNSLAGTPGTNPPMPQISQPPSQLQSAVATPSAPVQDPKPSEATDQPAVEAPSGTDDLLDLDVEMSGMANTDDKGAENDWVMVDQNSGAQPSATDNLSTTTTEPVATGTVQTSGTEVETTTPMFDTTDFGTFDSLVDSAGDALADYTNVEDNLGLDLVEDSAFGDAFQGTETHHGGAADGDNAL